MPCSIADSMLRQMEAWDERRVAEVMMDIAVHEHPQHAEVAGASGKRDDKGGAGPVDTKAMVHASGTWEVDYEAEEGCEQAELRTRHKQVHACDPLALRNDRVTRECDCRSES